MSALLDELDFYRREVLTAQQQFFAYLAMHRVAHDEPAVLAQMNREATLWLTLRETCLQGAITTLGRIFDEGSGHNANALIRIASAYLSEFSLKSLLARKIAAGVDQRDAAAYVAEKHQLDAADMRAMRREIQDLRQLWEAGYRDIRHKVYAHSEVTVTRDLFARTRIDELMTMLDRLERIHDDLFEAYHNGRKPGSKHWCPLEFPPPEATAGRQHRAGENVYGQTEAMLRRMLPQT